jgi:hypothetical protein
MSDQPRPNLSLPEAEGLHSMRRGVGVLSFLALVALLAVLVLQILIYVKPAPAEPRTAATAAAADDWNDLALKATQRNLHGAAADAWSKLLGGTADREKRGKILYQLGVQQMQSGAYEPAVMSFWQAEQFLGAGHDLASTLTDRIAECLERLGKYDEKDRELRERVGVGIEKETAGKLCAEIGIEKIALHDLEARIAREVDLRLRWLLALSPDMEQQARKQLLAPYADPQKKLQKLYDLVGQQVLYRRGRELKIDQDPELSDLLAQTRIQLIANAVLAQELRDKIKPTEVDLRMYFQAHPDKFQTPPRATVRVAPFPSKDAAEKAVAAVKTEADLSAAATVDGKDTSVLAENISPQDPFPRLGRVPSLVQAIFAMKGPGVSEKPVEAGNAFFVFFLRSLEPPQTPAFESAQGQVLNQYVQEKQAELQQALIQELFTKYGAAVHDDVVLGSAPKADEATKADEKSKKTDTPTGQEKSP